jgi:hypothetical protein
MAVWFKLFVFSFAKKNPEIDEEPIKSVFIKKEILSRGFLKNFLFLFAAVLFAAVNGFWKNDFGDAFLDLNGWLFLAFLFPFYEVVFNKELWEKGEDNPFWSFAKVIVAGLIWLSFKTFAVLFLFSHIIGTPFGSEPFSTFQVYRWVRTTGVGEITNMPSGFVRVFFQSHIYVLFVFYILLLMIGRFWGEMVKNKKLLFFATFFLSIVICLVVVSFSRSFWVGLAVAFLGYLIVAWKRFGVKRVLISLLILLISFVVGASLILAVVKFPYPKSNANFNLTDALADRAKKISGEPAASSRKALLPVLFREIEKSLVIGDGFGKVVAYKTEDQRALESSSSGLYKTYAFEWGWLDVWLKMGAIGMFIYLLLFYKMTVTALDKKTFWCDAMLICLLTFFVVNIFTPYANHPLGFGFLLLAAALISWEKKPCPCA